MRVGGAALAAGPGAHVGDEGDGVAPVIGRIHYEVKANFAGKVCVRLDYSLGKHNHSAWDYTDRPLWGKGMLDVGFLPISPSAEVAADFRGPLVLFVHFVEAAEPAASKPRVPISNTGAAMVEIV